VTASGNRLEVRSPDSGSSRHQIWDLKVPSGGLGSIDLRANAGSSGFDLSGADLSSFSAEVNAADLRVDATEATVGRLDLSMNAGRARITLGSGAVNGDLKVNAGAIDLCVPSGSGLRIHLTDQLTFAHNLDHRGLVQSGQTWTRSGADSGSMIDLTVDGAAASFTLDPEGGCR
jgi:hypothetical protein